MRNLILDTRGKSYRVKDDTEHGGLYAECDGEIILWDSLTEVEQEGITTLILGPIETWPRGVSLC